MNMEIEKASVGGKTRNNSTKKMEDRRNTYFKLPETILIKYNFVNFE